jgi:hypothetical protein
MTSKKPLIGALVGLFLGIFSLFMFIFYKLAIFSFVGLVLTPVIIPIICLINSDHCAVGGVMFSFYAAVVVYIIIGYSFGKYLEKKKR